MLAAQPTFVVDTARASRIQPAATNQITRRHDDSAPASFVVPAPRIQVAESRPGTVIRRVIGEVPPAYVPLQATKRPQEPKRGATGGGTPAPSTPAPTGPIGAAPTTLAELAANATASHAAWIGNNDVLLDILLGPLEANWFKAKACLTMEQWPATCTVTPSHEVGIKLMAALVVMRKAKWTNFVNTVVKPGFKERMAMFGQVRGPLEDLRKPSTVGKPGASHVLDPAALSGDVDLQSDLDQAEAERKNLQDIFPSVGAEAVTSDVDLASGGSNSELGVQFVNSRFRTHFVRGRVIPYDPGTVFDINVYASDWIHGEAGFKDSAEGTRTITPGAEVDNMSEIDQLQRTARMEIWSLVKVRRNLSEDEWATFTAKTLVGLTSERAHAIMSAKLANADQEYRTFHAQVEARQKKMLASLTAQEQAFFGGKESAFGHDGDHYAEDASFTRAANSIYEENLQKVKELRVQIEQLRADPVKNEKAISSLGVVLADKIAEALTYANEVYATEGAVQHTVLKQGAGKKLEKLQKEKGQTQLTAVDYDLKPELYQQAVNENVGDSLHSIEHFKTTPRYAIYRAGKYLSRLCDATNLLLGAKKSDVPEFAPLSLIGSESVRVKKITVGDIEGDPKFVDDDAFFKKYGPGDLATVRSQIIAFGAAIPTILAAKQRDDRAAADLAKQRDDLAKSTAASSSK